MIYTFLAEGFEEIEALTPVDLLRRKGKEVITVGVGGKNMTGRSGITVIADTVIDEIVLNDEVEMIFLPGGMPGTENLYSSVKVREAVSYCFNHNIFIAAICAAPSILGRMGLLKNNVKATCYPGFEKFLEGASISSDSVVRDGKIITAKGAGVSVKFALELVRALCGDKEAESLGNSIIYE
ncbi:MAG: DJ-1/PfpI family protein [Oscillospiraceae bacterium]|nr:DJ-1/PfpI family protein [Oscillospiraceae bacterium]